LSAPEQEAVPLVRRPLTLPVLAPWIALFLPLFVYSIGFRYIGSGDTVPAELLPISLLENHGFDFREFVAGDLPYWFRLVRGRVVSNYPVLPGILNLPVYAAARLAHVDLYTHRFLFSMLTSSGIAALSVLFLYLALKRVCRSEKEALFFALVYAFGTTAWSVASRGLFQHGPSVLFLSIALWALYRGGGSVPIAGLALSLAVINRPTNILIALPLALYVLRYERRRFPAFMALALPAALFHAWYANAYWGSPFSSAQDVSRANFAGGFWKGLAGLLVSPSRGLFVFTPVFLFALPAAAAAFRPAPPGSRRLARYLVAGVVATIALYSLWSMWWGGHTFGYRLITEIAPLLTILVASYWPAVARSRGATAALGLCVLFSLYVHLLGAMVFPSGFNNGLDQHPERLWDLRNSELELSTRKLIRIALASSRLAAAFEPAQRMSPPATAWWRPDLEDASIPGWIDTPLDGQRVSGRLEASGWARSARGPVEVRVAISPDGLVPTVERFPRPDIQRSRPELGDCSQAGWRIMVEKPVAGAAEHALLVELRDPNGRVRRLGPIHFRWKS
jgi:hypothetical protein